MKKHLIIATLALCLTSCGMIEITTTSKIFPGRVSFATDQTWTIGSQTWSDAVHATYCNKTEYDAGTDNNFKVDCRSNPGYKGSLFSWTAVAEYKNKLCPAPWRVARMGGMLCGVSSDSHEMSQLLTLRLLETSLSKCY